MIVVTGATGSLGSNITRALVECGERVAIMRRENEDLSALAGTAGDVRHRIADVRDAGAVDRALRDAEAVYHLAAITAPTNALRGLMYRVNVDGTRNVMQAALRAGSRVVHTSSIAAIGYPDAGTVASESFPFNGTRFRHAYMTTKHETERVVLEHVERGLDAVIVNPSATMAPGGDLRNGWAGLVVQACKGRLVAYPGGGLGMLTRAEMVEAHLKAMKLGHTGERYILNSKNLTYRELLTEIASVVAVSPPRWRIPDRALSRVASGLVPLAFLIRDPVRKPLLRPENVPLLTRTMYYDSSKARRDLGLAPTSLREAIVEVADWCERRGGFR